MEKIGRPRIGARIEFYEDLDADGAPAGEFIGAALKDDAFVAAMATGAGDRVSTRSLAGGTTEVTMLHDAGMGVPFARVAHVEHYPVPVNATGAVESWGEGSPRTASTLVFHARAITDADRSMQLAQTLTMHGWNVAPDLVRFAERGGG